MRITRFIGTVLSVACALVVSSCATSSIRPSSSIAPAKPIADELFVPINGIEQWLTIHGGDETKPVLLILHGGPGGAESFLKAQMRPFEHDFVVVNWDQRGAGRTLARAGGVVGPTVSRAVMVDDGLAVADYLRRRLHRDKIVLLGFSWGSDLGVNMAEAKPSYFSAYVGTGQAAELKAVIDPWVYQHLLDLAGAAHDVAMLDELKSIGPPPWTAEATQRLYRAAARYRGRDLSTAEMTKAAAAAALGPSDVQALLKGRSAYKGSKLEDDIAAFDPKTFGDRLKVPIAVIEGREDQTAPPVFAEKWLARIPARKKVFRTIAGGGHQVMLTQPGDFDRELVAALSQLGR